jgi:hypothetical protein
MEDCLINFHSSDVFNVENEDVKYKLANFLISEFKSMETPRDKLNGYLKLLKDGKKVSNPDQTIKYVRNLERFLYKNQDGWVYKKIDDIEIHRVVPTKHIDLADQLVMIRGVKVKDKTSGSVILYAENITPLVEAASENLEIRFALHTIPSDIGFVKKTYLQCANGCIKPINQVLNQITTNLSIIFYFFSVFILLMCLCALIILPCLFIYDILGLPIWVYKICGYIYISLVYTYIYLLGNATFAEVYFSSFWAAPIYSIIWKCLYTESISWIWLFLYIPYAFGEGILFCVIQTLIFQTYGFIKLTGLIREIFPQGREIIKKIRG